MPLASQSCPWQVLEIGAGTGAMVQRLLEWDFLHYAAYTALDTSPLFLTEARHALSRWAEQNGLHINQTSEKLSLAGKSREVTVQFVAEELNHWLATASHPKSYDLLIAHAFLDLVNLDETLPPLLSCLKKGGVFYFTINFDGLTVFEPPLQHSLDETILSLYHRTMQEHFVGEKLRSGATCGRRLLTAVGRAGGSLLRAGASDWIIHPVQGKYLPGEDRFLRYFLQMIDEALREQGLVEPTLLRSWLDQRINQIERGELMLIVHQLDLVGRC